MTYVFMAMIFCGLVSLVAFTESYQFYKSRKTKQRNLCIGFAFLFFAFDAYMWCENYASVYGH